MYKLCVFIPQDHLELVKQAMFDVGAGKIGNYDQCCWQSLGQGQFRPLANSHPHIGEINRLQQVDEYKVELVVEKHHIHAVIAAMKLAHPYEEPAFDVWQLADI